MLDLGYWSLGCLVDPPPTPPVGTWGHACPFPMRAMEPWAVHFSIIFSLRFSTRLGSVLGSLWEPKSGQVGPKMRLEPSFVRKWRCSKNIEKRKARATFLTPRWAQDRLKTGPRWLQEGSKHHVLLVIIFGSFRDLLQPKTLPNLF